MLYLYLVPAIEHASVVPPVVPTGGGGGGWQWGFGQYAHKTPKKDVVALTAKQSARRDTSESPLERALRLQALAMAAQKSLTKARNEKRPDAVLPKSVSSAKDRAAADLIQKSMRTLKKKK